MIQRWQGMGKLQFFSNRSEHEGQQGTCTKRNKVPIEMNWMRTTGVPETVFGPFAPWVWGRVQWFGLVFLNILCKGVTKVCQFDWEVVLWENFNPSYHRFLTLICHSWSQDELQVGKKMQASYGCHLKSISSQEGISFYKLTRAVCLFNSWNCRKNSKTVHALLHIG